MSFLLLEVTSPGIGLINFPQTYNVSTEFLAMVVRLFDIHNNLTGSTRHYSRGLVLIHMTDTGTPDPLRVAPRRVIPTIKTKFCYQP